jgi:putative ABC transport system substrate-binding protein
MSAFDPKRHLSLIRWGPGLSKVSHGRAGNATGFMVFEYSLSAKWPELLKEVAPNVTRVAVLRDPSISSDIGQFAVIQSVTASIGLEPSPIDVDDPSAIERSVADFANSPNGGLIIVAGARTATHRT